MKFCLTRPLALSVFSLALLGCSSASSGGTGDGTGGLGGATNGAGGTGGLSTGGGPATGASGGVPGSGGGATVKRQRVVGYLPTWRSFDPSALDFDTLTHLCIAFAYPSGPSNALTLDADVASLDTLIAAAHAKDVKVLLSLAGAAGGAATAARIVPATVDAFVSEVVEMIEARAFDGVDVDIEGENVNDDYEPFVKKLRAALPAEKLLTAAVATWNGDDFSDGALAEYDFLNLMSYDHCGSWSSACDHALYSKTLEELEYWETTRGIPADEVVVGVPFYGYCWGASCPAAAMTYPEILAFDADGRTSDYLVGDGYEISLNGPATLAQKVELAKLHGGLMIWELGQDGVGDDSLFAVVRAGQE